MRQTPRRYVSPYVTDRWGAYVVFGQRFAAFDYYDFGEFLMEQLLAEHWFEGVEHFPPTRSRSPRSRLFPKSAGVLP